MSSRKRLRRKATGVKYTHADIARLAVAQNEQSLKTKFLNIVSVSDAVHDLSNPESHVIAIYLKDANKEGIPEKLKVKMPDGTFRFIATEITTSVGIARIQYSQLNTGISNTSDLEYIGSVCCAVKSEYDDNFVGVVTSAHIYTLGVYDINNNGLLSAPQQTSISLNNITSGKWCYKVLNNNQDLAVAQLNNGQQADPDYKTFNNQFYSIGDADVKTPQPNVTMLSKGNKTTQAFIIDYNVALNVNYDVPSYKTNVILMGNTNDRDTCQPVSLPGDSGSCVYHTETGNLVGILLGSTDKFSLVLPIQDTLNSFGLITI